MNNALDNRIPELGKQIVKIIHPTKHLCFLVPTPIFLYLVPFMHQISAEQYIA